MTKRQYFTYLQLNIFNLIWGICTNKNRRQIKICTIREVLKVHTLQSTIWYKGTFAALLAHSSHHWIHAFVFKEFPQTLLSKSQWRCGHIYTVDLLPSWSETLQSVHAHTVGGFCPSLSQEVLVHVFSQWDGSAKFQCYVKTRPSSHSLINNWIICS